MDRRKFIKDAAAFSAAVPLLGLGGKAFADDVAGPSLAVGEGPKWYDLTRAVVEKLGGMSAFVKPGHKVVLKPNASFDRTPEQGSNVHPDVTRAVIEMCLEAGAQSVTLVDRNLAEERRCWMNSGIGPMVESMADERVKISTYSERKLATVKIDKGIAFQRWKFYKEALEADSYINLPVAKHHGSAQLTLGLKNILGIIGGNRGKIHVSLDQGIVDLNTVVKSTLTVIDATRVLLRNGPSGGNLEDVDVKNTVIASADIVAADAYATRHMFDRDPREIGHIKIAGESGLGQIDLEKVTVLKA
jgi:uncharacterized protein (DUF362 family)